MKAFQFVAAQKPPELRDVPVPEPGAGQVLIKIGGAGRLSLRSAHTRGASKARAGPGALHPRP